MHHQRNRGYGGALRSGFEAATRELVFYTDGDAQYDPDGDGDAVARASTTAWIWSTATRSAAPIRCTASSSAASTITPSSCCSACTVRDVDCDFRLLRRSIFDRVPLEKSSGVICLEMMKKIQDAGFTIAEVPVHHYHRVYGKSQFFNFRRLFKTAVDVALSGCRTW